VTLLRSALLLVVAATVATTGCAAPGDAAAPERTTIAPTAARAPGAAVGSPTAMAPSRPVRLRIADASVDTALTSLGLQPSGAMEVPKGGFPAGWYSGGPTPGARGPAVLAGHVDWDGRAAVFARLDRLAPGDGVDVDREDGSTASFRVTRVERFAKDAFPTDAVYGDTDGAELRLVTCGGAFDSERGHYDDNVVVFARLV
jgi:hypothetical protein